MVMGNVLMLLIFSLLFTSIGLLEIGLIYIIVQGVRYAIKKAKRRKSK